MLSQHLSEAKDNERAYPPPYIIPFPPPLSLSLLSIPRLIPLPAEYDTALGPALLPFLPTETGNLQREAGPVATH